MNELKVLTTAIPGLLVVELPLHPDPRGWFKENWQREKMIALGLPDFVPVQNNMSHNTQAGVTRGFHAEPWDKLISVASGRIFGAWVDLREGESFGQVVTVEMGPEKAVFVPAGVGNSYQALEDGTTYTYLVNEHWSAEARSKYTYLNLADETVGVDWPIPLAEATLSEADLNHPRLAEVRPFPPDRILVTGAKGQLGRALAKVFPQAELTDLDELDISDPASIEAFDFSGVRLIINAAAWTQVDAAEEAQARAICWAANATGPARLAQIARQNRAVLVHISSDYVFDGSNELHPEDEPLSPLGVYGASKAAGDLAVGAYSKHYILRTSWVIGEGRNFVATMASLAERGINPAVVDDQFGRLSFTSEIARAIRHLLKVNAPYGVYNISCDGPIESWFDIAAKVYGGLKVEASPTRIDTESYGAGKTLSPRPVHSALDLAKIRTTGFVPALADDLLADYLKELSATDK